MNLIKKIVFMLILFFVSVNIFSATSLPEYEPYGENEFPTWAKKLRRAEIITLGATAFTYPVMGLFVKMDDNSMSGFWTKFGIAAGVGACIALVDYIIGETSQKKTTEKNEPIINLSPNSKEALDLEELKKSFAEQKNDSSVDYNYDHENAKFDLSSLEHGIETETEEDSKYNIDNALDLDSNIGLDSDSDFDSNLNFISNEK